MVFSRTTAQYVPFEPRYDSDGTVWLKVQAHGDLTAKTCYKVIINEFGLFTAALANDTKEYYVGVPPAAISSGDVDWVQFGGYIADMVTESLSATAGYALRLYQGTVVQVSSDFSGAASQFAALADSESAAATHNAMLRPVLIIGTS